MAGASRDQTQAIPFANSWDWLPFFLGFLMFLWPAVHRWGWTPLSQFMHQRFSWFPPQGQWRLGRVFRMNSARLHLVNLSQFLDRGSLLPDLHGRCGLVLGRKGVLHVRLPVRRPHGAIGSIGPATYCR